MSQTVQFDDFAVAALPLPHGYGEFFRKWLAAGYGAALPYLEDSQRYQADCGRPWAKYAVALAKKLPLREAGFPLPPAPLDNPELIGSVSLYALGNDYHLVLPKMAADFIAGWKIAGKTEITVDSTPVNERAVALAAGLAKRGRHAGLIHPELGTHFVLAIVFCEDLPEVLAQKARNIPPEEAEYACSNCHLCQKSCPVQALDEIGLNTAKCLSYWTIEHRGEFPPELVAKGQVPLFGCDLCLRSCPHSHLSQKQLAGKVEAVLQARDYIFSHSNKSLEKELRGTAYSRARGNGLKRNLHCPIKK